MHIFVSYSRQEFYFADSVVAVLQAAGHTVWFDVQQLSPGLDWKQGIKQGLWGCDALVLIASRASIASGNVAYEWRSAQLLCKPVYVLTYEAVTLPARLKPHAVIGGRGTFERTIRRLRECLEDGEQRQDAIPKPNRWNHLPPRIRIMAGVLAISSLWSALLALFLLGNRLFVKEAESGPGLALPGILLAVTGIYALSILRKLLDRRFTRIEIYLGMLAPAIGTFALLAANAPPPDALRLVAGWWAVMPILALIVARYHYRLALYHWMLRGQVGQETQQFYQDWFGTKPGERRKAQMTDLPITMEGFQAWVQSLSPQGASVPADAQSIRYALYYAPADQTIADQLDATLAHFGHGRVDSHADETADQHFMIVSNQTPKSLMAQAQDASHPFTLVLASSTNIDEAALLTYQIVDYRRRSQKQLNAIASYFANPQAGRQAYGLHHLPQRFDWIVMPRIVSGVALLMRIAGAFFIALALVVWLSMLPGLQSVSGFVPQTDVLSLLLYTLLGLCGLPLISLSDALVERRIPARTFNRRAGGLLVGVVGLLVLLIFREQEVAGALGSMLRAFAETGSGGQQFLVLVVILIGSIIPAGSRIRLWLPAQIDTTMPKDQRLVVADLPYIQAGVRDTVIIALLLGAILFLR